MEHVLERIKRFVECIEPDEGDKGSITPMDFPIRDSENADIPIMAPGFGSDFVELIEQNRRRSIATSRILRLRHGEIWPEDGMLKRDIGVFRVPKHFTGQ